MMAKKILQRLTARMQPRVIWGRDGTTRYLSRYYLFGRPKMPDGSSPFDAYGNPKPGALWPKRGVGLYLHRFHESDGDFELHCHPWRFAASFVLAGGYLEERRVGSEVKSRLVRPGRLNFIGRNTFHRVDLLDGECWSLFLAGPKAGTWGFWCRATGAYTEWREFLARKQGRVVDA